MWKPGMLLHHDVGWVRCNGRLIDKGYCLVISVTKTGFGTKGNKWDALLLTHSGLITVNNAWKTDRQYTWCCEG